MMRQQTGVREHFSLRQYGGAFDCRARRRAAGATGFFDGDLSPVAVDVHFEDRRMMNQTINRGQGYGLIWKNPSPFAEGLIGGDQHRSPLVSRADQFEQNAGFRLILGDIGEVVENQQMIFVELGDRRFEHEVASRDLEFLHEVGGSGEQHAPAFLDQRQAERRRQMRFSAAGRPEAEKIGALFDAGVASGERLHLRFRDHRHCGEVKRVEGLAGR